MSSVCVKHEFPPNIEELRAHFPLTGTEIFAYDKVIYHPGPGHLTAPLIAHECVHFKQQGNDSQGWWQQYIDHPEFRYRQELEAHREELSVFCSLCKDRNLRWKYAISLAKRMRSPMYGMHEKSTVWDVLRQVKGGIL